MLAIATGTGTQDTNLGNRLLYNAAVAYRIFGETAGETHSHDPRAAYAHAGHSHSPMVTKAPATAAAPHTHVALDGLLEINGEWHDKQRTAGVVDPNSGGNTIYVSPGLRLTVENWSSYVLVNSSVNDLNGFKHARMAGLGQRLRRSTLIHPSHDGSNVRNWHCVLAAAVGVTHA